MPPEPEQPTFLLCGEERPDLIDYYPDSVRTILQNYEYAVFGFFSSYNDPLNSACSNLKFDSFSADVDGDGVAETHIKYDGHKDKYGGNSIYEISSDNPTIQWNTLPDTAFLDTIREYIGWWITGYIETTKDKADTLMAVDYHRVLSKKELEEDIDKLVYGRPTLISKSTSSSNTGSRYDLGKYIGSGRFYHHSVFKLGTGERRVVRWFIHDLIYNPDRPQAYGYWVIGADSIYTIP